MLFSFLHNRPNGSFVSPVTCCAREKGAIIPFLKTAINNCDQPTIPIVLLLIQLSNLLSLSKVFCVVGFSKFFARMSQKDAKTAKNKHGVKVMGLKKDSPAPTPISTSSATVDPQEILDVQPVQHESPKSAKPDFPKKKFKSRYSTRYRHSMKGKSYVSSTSPIDIPDEDDVDEIITKVVDSVSQETAAEIESPDVRPNVATSGTSGNPIFATPLAVVVDEPIVEEPESEDEESVDQDSEEETEEEKSDPSTDDDVINQTIVQ